MYPRPVFGLQIAVGCNFEVLQVLGAEWTREDSGGQLVPDGDNCVTVGSTQIVSGTDWKFIGQLVCVCITYIDYVGNLPGLGLYPGLEVLADWVNSMESGCASSAAQVFNTRGGILSGPVAFDGLSWGRVRSTAATRKRTSERAWSVRGLVVDCIRSLEITHPVN